MVVRFKIIRAEKDAKVNGKSQEAKNGESQSLCKSEEARQGVNALLVLEIAILRGFCACRHL